MTISEFRAWLDGFKEAVGEAPTPEQWAKVLEKIAAVHEPFIPATGGFGRGPLIPHVAPSIPDCPPHWWPSVTCRNDVASCTNESHAYVNGQYAGPAD